MKARTVFLSLAAGCTWVSAMAQGGLEDTSIAMVPITLSYAYQLPSGDLGQQFGPNHNVGISVARKFKSNYSLGLEGSFIFGNNVTDQSMLRNITASNGTIVNQDGDPAKILLYERGYTVMAVAGKLMPIAGPNPNSGILLKLGAGYMRHRVLIESQNDVVPALEGEYQKGYDRLAAGLAGMFFVGYQHLGNNRRINFLVGFELNIGFTESLRPFNFDSRRADTGTHFDGLNGLRVGWTLPIYKARDNREYYR
ncbi:MAG: hypothetical protein JST45_00200 [Bacteroidetes bacterium]|nr:hypothetical protein [Bacteroidota bacterium]